MDWSNDDDQYTTLSKNIMKKILIFIFAVSLSVTVSAQDTPYITKSLSSEIISAVLSKTSGGGISVSGVSNSEARVEVYIRSSRGEELSKDEIKRKLEDDYTLTLSVSGNKLR
jgi:hypothetical protein